MAVILQIGIHRSLSRSKLRASIHPWDSSGFFSFGSEAIHRKCWDVAQPFLNFQYERDIKQPIEECSSMTLNKNEKAKRLLQLLAVMVISLSLAHVHADDDGTTESTTTHLKRPIEELFKTHVVYPQEKGELELAVASVYQKHAGGNVWTLPMSLEYGLTECWQVEAEWDTMVQRYPSNHSVVRGVGDFEVSTQYTFLNIDGSSFHIAPWFSIQVPTGNVNKDLSDGFVQYQPSVILAKDFPDLHHTQFFSEIGINFLQRINSPVNSGNAKPAAHEFSFGSGLFVLFPHSAPTLEFNWLNNNWNNHGTENQMYLTPGYLWRVLRNAEIGLGMPVGLNRGSDKFQIIGHFVWEF